MVYEICAVVITFVIVILSYFLIDVIRKLKITLTRVDTLTYVIENKIIPISEETTKILENTKTLTDSINGQVSALNPVFDSISRLGNTFQDAAAKMSRPERKPIWQDRVADIAELAALGIIAWQKIKERR